MPKPTAITYGLTRSELLFYEAPASSNIYFKHDSGKVGRVSVSGGDMTVKELIKELDWIVPGSHQWDIQAVGDHTFKVVFPSKADLNRVNKIKDIPVDSNMFLHFKEWSASDLDKFSLQKTWVKVGGCPYKERCDYLALFAVGSLIGKATEIDMEYTRSHDEVRMFVEVTDINHIPTGADHVYEGQGYGLTFEVEGGITQASTDIDMDANVDDEGDPKEERKNEDMGNPNVSLNSKSKSNLKQVDGSSQNGKQVASTPLTMQFGTVSTPSKFASASVVDFPRSLRWEDRVEED
jgi:hypothetical protein